VASQRGSAMNIFISYSRADQRIVRRVFDLLKSYGHNPWMDTEQIQAGSRWRKEVEEAIEAAEVFLIILSANSVGSNEMQRELDLAGDIGRRVVPVLLNQGTTIPSGMRLLLARLQWLYLGDDFDAGARELLKTLGVVQKRGPLNYVWGVEKDDVDVKLLSTMFADENTPAGDRLTRFLLYIAGLRNKAQERLLSRIRAMTEKESHWLEQKRRAADRTRNLARERSHLKEVAPDSEALRLIDGEYLKALREERSMYQSHSGDDESAALSRDMEAIRNSCKPFDDLVEEIRRSEQRVLDRLNRS